MSIFKKLTFGGIDSADYGVYINGEGVYNAPEKDVEMITIPGRNGSFAFDRGRFNNIEVSYPAGAGDSSQPDFAQRVRNLRNALASKIGYQRLEDDYNPDEYRMGVFKSGLEVSPAHYGTAGEFDVVFDCKPQRFLKSGETEVSVANNGTITNPTEFDSQPLLAVVGSGEMTVNGYKISLEGADLGYVSVFDPGEVTFPGSSGYPQVTIDVKDLMAVGDTFTATYRAHQYLEIIEDPSDYKGYHITGCSSSVAGPSATDPVGSIRSIYAKEAYAVAMARKQVLTYGTSASFSVQTSYTINYEDKDGNEYTGTGSVRIGLSYDGAHTVTLTFIGVEPLYNFLTVKRVTSWFEGTAYSTLQSLGNPNYIDCEIGEAYTYKNGELVSINNFVTIGSELPKLSPGSNTVTYENTITSVKITPRWWRV